MPLINKKSSTNTRISQGLESLLIGGSGSSSVKSFEATYKIGRKLMGGSYGTVYEGVNIKTKREFAIKVIERRYAYFTPAVWFWLGFCGLAGSSHAQLLVYCYDALN